MIIEKVWLRNFRNYEKAEITWNPNMNVITGNNAQGKTNLLESLVYLSLTRSHRLHEDNQLIQFDKEMAKIGCEVMEEDEKTKLEVVLHPGGKTLLLNNQPIQRSSEFIGKLNVVLFSPDDLNLFQDAPRSRRRVMDQEITKMNYRYLLALNQYRTLLKNRNALLKQYHVDESYLDTLDEQMIQAEITIIEERKKFIKGINFFMNAIYQELADEKNEIHLTYESCVEEANEEALRNLYVSNRKKDLETHVSNVGIHREDMQFMMNDKNLLQIASQGQKRMVMLSFKIALLKVIKEITKKNPVLLLDDVLSELDKHRQAKLITMIGNTYQCMITTTAIPEALQNEAMNEYRVEQGKIQIVGGRK